MIPAVYAYLALRAYKTQPHTCAVSQRNGRSAYEMREQNTVFGSINGIGQREHPCFRVLS